jgi:hypothetical protein
MVSKKKEVEFTTTTTTEKPKRVSKKKDVEITTTTTTTEKPKRKRTTKAEKAEKAESKSKSEHTTHERFTAEINGRQCEGIMVKFDDRSIYLCQDFAVGGFISKRLRQGYKFSIYVGYDKVTASFVKNFKIIK